MQSKTVWIKDRSSETRCRQTEISERFPPLRQVLNEGADRGQSKAGDQCEKATVQVRPNGHKRDQQPYKSGGLFPVAYQESGSYREKPQSPYMRTRVVM